MHTDEVVFYSDGFRIAALWRTPDVYDRRVCAIVQGPGWIGLRDARLYVPYHEALTAAGFGVLALDYRGFGASQGIPHRLPVHDQITDLVNAVTYLTTRNDVDADSIGAFGSGGTGGGNVILLAARDRRIRAVVSQVPVADGADWLHRMRTEHEWMTFLKALDEDRRTRVLTGEGRLVHPREEIMVPTPERRATAVKADVDERIPSAVSLSAADEILAYRPIDAARELRTPLMVIGVENDATTPTDHAIALYEAARGPRQLVMQRKTSHYAAYDQYREIVTPMIVDWFNRYLVSGDVVIRTAEVAVEKTAFVGGHHVG